MAKMKKPKVISKGAKVNRAAAKASPKAPITADMKIGEAVGKYPQIARAFLQHGLFCVGCGAAAFESIEQGAMAHGIALGPLLADLNKAAMQKK